jgi:hypothetical protein
MEEHMATLYFHCAGTQEVLLDRGGSEIEDLFDACARAFQIIQSMVSKSRECRSTQRTGVGAPV